MATAGLQEEPIVEQWLSEAEQDPMAEVRLTAEKWRYGTERDGEVELAQDT